MTGDSPAAASAGAGGGVRYRRGLEAVARRIADEFLLVPLRGGCADLQRVYALSPVAEHVWETLGDGERTLEELCSAVLDAFEVDRPTAERDLRAFLAELEREGLVARRTGER